MARRVLRTLRSTTPADKRQRPPLRGLDAGHAHWLRQAPAGVSHPASENPDQLALDQRQDRGLLGRPPAGGARPPALPQLDEAKRRLPSSSTTTTTTDSAAR